MKLIKLYYLIISNLINISNMYSKIDNKLVKYLIILLFVYYCANKITIGNFPITDPFHFTISIGIILYVLDTQMCKPISISEKGFDIQIFEIIKLMYFCHILRKFIHFYIL